MSKIDCKIAENFLKEWHRMCEHRLCDECPMNELRKKKVFWECQRVVMNAPDEAVAIVQKWSNEHPVKTIKDDFLEKYPNAKLNAIDGTPKACPCNLGYEEECIANNCFACWNRPLSEVQK